MIGTRFINGFLKNEFSFGQMDQFAPKNGTSSITLDLLLDFFRILRSEKGDYVDEINNNDFYQNKICWGQMGHFGPRNCASS